MKKILIAADTYVPKIDGIMRFLSEIIPRLKHEYDITLLVPDYHQSWHEKEVRLKLSHMIKLSGYATMALSLSNINKIRHAVKEADTIFIQGPALISLCAAYFGRKYHKHVLWYVHLMIWELYEKHLPRWTRWLLVPLIKRLVTAGYKKCDVLIVPYKKLVRELEAMGIGTRKTVINLGADTALFIPAENKQQAKEKLGIDPAATVIGYVGRVSKEKNISVLLEAVARLQEYKLTTLIVGSGAESEMNAVKETKNTLTPGFVKDVVPYYQAMDIFVMPSLTETTSLATLEAMACGVPVITTRVGFLREYVRRDYNGLLFPKGNTFTLMLQLRKLIKNSDMRLKMGENARATALSFSWDNTAKRIKKILEENDGNKKS